ncbi:DUF4184 family protein [Providencia heimbachae]|uniref:Conserved membrane-spanning protein n=1 Tax=Providencia heimbachae ATCC 35613 TaxID=1354272 RepID=A0A1B7K3I9_9GAMM|nr:DUF4184 family protein [Providencia heimbachae]MDD9339950.1 DUF4184 family protein [Providencia heimbachae]OAT54718.1 conserved membrane-spanning protein [Providencia heimbachae ATCC 35613]QCJ70136.1 DUF4184 domain-containing protein [Providencia heimbachae]SQH13320.1 Uncharacterised protein [Providencia heimbachae]
MPWTFSHPAVVFPLKQSKWGRFLNLPALIMGSLSPDLLYSFGLYHTATTAHYFIGWFYTGLPVCLIIYIGIYLLATPLKQVIPFPIEKNNQWDKRYFITLLFSLFIGAATHIVWDSFTHESGAAVRNLPLLQFGLINMTDRQEITIYKILQHLGSLLGLLYLCFKYFKFHQRQSKKNQQANLIKLKNLLLISICAGIIAFPLAYYLAINANLFNFNRFVYLELTLSVPFFFGIIIGYALFKNYKSSKMLT